MKMLFVFNPNSGKSQIKKELLEIIKILSNGGYEVTIYPSKAPKDIYNHVRMCEGKFDVIACSGGDGTLNEAVAAVMEFAGEKPPIGYIPSGTTNDFARSLHIPKDMQRAAKNIVEGYVQKVDIGTFNGRYYNYVAAFGAFTEVSYATPQQFKKILGHQAYVLEGVKSIPAIKPFHIRVSSAQKCFEGDYLYGMITNAKSVGGFKNLTGRHVRMNDGLFECTFVKVPNLGVDGTELLNSIVNFDGNLLKNAVIEHFHASDLTVYSNTPLAWVLDGEFGGNVADAEIHVEPSALKIIVPEKI